jgi:hypothetical protein
MVVVVADAILEASRRPRRLNAPQEAAGDKDAKRVVDRLVRDRSDLRSDHFRYPVSRDVRLIRHRTQHPQSLRGDLNTVLTKELNGVGHA